MTIKDISRVDKMKKEDDTKTVLSFHLFFEPQLSLFYTNLSLE